MGEDERHVDQHTAPDTIDLRDYLRVLARQWRIVAGITIVVVTVALVSSFLQTPVYESSSEVAIEPVRSGSDAALEDLLLRDEIVETERRVITSRNVTDRVIAELGLDMSSAELLDRVSVRAIPNTRVVTISATSTDPQWAAAVANSFATSYLDYRRDRALDEVTAARSNLSERARELQEEIDAIEAELGPSGADAATLSPDDQSLVAQRDALAQQVAQIAIQLAALDPGGGAIRGGGEILVPAEPTNSPVSPRPLRTGVLALVLGLMLGVGAAFLRDHFDDAIRGEDDVKRATEGQPIVGRITSWDDEAADQKLITLVDPFAANSEEFQALAANVRFALLSRAGRHATVRDRDERPAGRSIAVTSSGQAEGKTTVAGNLAVAAAAAGRRVILVGADLRKPTMARRFGLPDGAGLTDALVNAAELTDGEKLAAHLVDVGIPRLRLLPAGSIPPNPTELLASSQMAWLHDSLAGMADLVVYDTPPILPVADTLELAHHADLTFIVVRAELCHRRDLSHAVERLHGVGAEVGGIVLNGLSSGRGGYGYGGYYGYGRQGTDEYRPRTVDEDRATGEQEAGASFSAVRVRQPSRGQSRSRPDSAPPPPGQPQPPDEAAGDAGTSGLEHDDDLDTWLFRNR